MTITVTPDKYSPVGAEIWYGLNSASSGLKDFKYIFDVYSYDLVSGTSNSIGSYKVPPRPDTGYGLISPSKILKPLMKYDVDTTITTPEYYDGVVKFGFHNAYSYNPGFTFSDITNYSGTHSWLKNDSGVWYDIQTDDIVTILMDQETNDYSGSYKIIDIVSAGSIQWIETDYPYTFVSAGGPGTVIALKRYDTPDTNRYYAYQGTRQYTEIDTDFTYERVIHDSNDEEQLLSNYKNYILSGTGSNLSNHIYGNTKNIFRDQSETISFLVDPGATHSFLNINTYNSTGVITSTNSVWLSSVLPDNGKDIRYDFPSGPVNLVDGGYVSSVNMNAAKYYSLAMIYEPNPFVTSTNYLKNIRYYEIVNNCSPYPTNYRLIFMNRHGGSDYWNFNYKSSNTVNQEQTIFRKQLPYNYSVGDRQDTVLSNKATETYVISTIWITESDAIFLKELLTSPDVSVYDEVNEMKLPILILDTTYKVKTAIDDKLFCITINFRFAYDINVQNL